MLKHKKKEGTQTVAADIPRSPSGLKSARYVLCQGV